MRFLITSKSRESMPPEMVMPAMQAMKAWVAEHRASGKLEQVWSFAGTDGGGGIADVASPEELDQLMAGFPFGQTSVVEVYPLADLESALDSNIEAFTAMMEAVGASA